MLQKCLSFSFRNKFKNFSATQKKKPVQSKSFYKKKIYEKDEMVHKSQLRKVD